LKLHGGAMVNDIIPYFKKNADVKTNSLTLCQNFVKYLNCFEEVSCLSKQELVLARDFIFTYYSIDIGIFGARWENLKHEIDINSIEDQTKRMKLMLSVHMLEDFEVLFFVTKDSLPG